MVRDSSKRRPARWQSARVLDTIEEAPDAITLRLELEESDGFLPGQYYNLRLSLPGRSGFVQRAYSVGSSPVPDPSIIDLGVREINGGLVSPRLVRDLCVGDRVDVRGPLGRFTWTRYDGGPVLLVGAGSGVVPLMSMIRYAVAENLDVPIQLVCSSSDYNYAFYHRHLTLLAERVPWLRVTHTFTRDPRDPRALHHRRVDQAMIAGAVAQQFPRRAYVCGPPTMVEDVQKWLRDLGVDPTTILVEKYD
jgi:ferredoxin-NADP reductase